MRGVHTFINDIRRQVFTEVARMAFEGGNYAKTIRELPYKRGGGNLPPHPPPSGAPFPIPSVPSGHHPYPFWPSAISP